VLDVQAMPVAEFTFVGSNCVGAAQVDEAIV